MSTATTADLPSSNGRSAQGAAFFDLDRTLLRRASALALAGSFRERGLIGRGQLAKAAANGEQQEAKRLDRIISKFVAGHPVPPVL